MTANGPGQSARLLVDVVGVLKSQGIDYAVIGALAVAVHGVMRASADADAIIAVTIPQLGALESALRSSGLKVEQRLGGVDDPIGAMLLISDRFGNRVDLLVGLRGLEGGVYDRAILVPISGLSTGLKIVGREDLIAMKLAAGSPKDILDAERCIAVAGDALDVELLRRLIRRFGREVTEKCERLLPKLTSSRP